MEWKSDGCLGLILGALSITPIPLGILWVYTEVMTAEDALQLQPIERVGLTLLDFAKWGVLFLGIYDVVTNGGVNVLRLSIPYVFCGLSTALIALKTVGPEEFSV